MEELLIANARVVTSRRVMPQGWVLVRSGQISALGEGRAPTASGLKVIDAQGLTLLPGFIDIHVHGAVGADTMDATLKALQKMADFYVTQGVTSFLPTTLTAPHEKIMAALHNVKAFMAVQQRGAQVLGAHLEGPYLNAAKSGAQNPQHIRRAALEEVEELLGVGVIRLAAVAPEFEENHLCIERCLLEGVRVSIAHTDATYEQTRDGIARGITHATHTFNAMRGLHHRDPGTVGAVMTAPEVRCELIPDNVHVHPGAMRVLWQMKGEEGVILITDAIRAAGMPDGNYTLGDFDVTVSNDKATLKDGTLAGSIVTMAQAVYNFMTAIGQPIEHIWRATSLNAAQAVRVLPHKGSIAIGKDADLVLVDEALNRIHLTVVEGRIEHDALH